MGNQQGPLYSTGNSARYSVTTCVGNGSEEDRQYVYLNRFALYLKLTHIINKLYANMK